MNDHAESLAATLIRNFNTAPMERFQRDPLYDAMGARLAKGTAARKLGASVDVVAPGKVTCPYHAHSAQEEMFVVIEGSGTLRAAGEMLPIQQGDVIFIPAGPEYPHQIINTSNAPLNTCQSAPASRQKSSNTPTPASTWQKLIETATRPLT